MTAPTPPKNLKTTQDKVAWLQSLSKADQEAFNSKTIMDSSWANAFEALNNPDKYVTQNDSSRKAPTPPPDVKTQDQRVAWLESLSEQDRKAFLAQQDKSDESSGVLGGVLNHTIFSGFNNPQSKDPWMQAEAARQAKDKASKSPTAANAAAQQGTAPDGSSLLGPGGGQVGGQSQADMLIDPVAAAFSSKNLSAADTISVMTSHPGFEPGGAISQPKSKDVPLSAMDTTITDQQNTHTSLQDEVKNLYSLDADGVKALQGRLYNANFLQGKYAPGVLDDGTLKAYMDVLVSTAQANNEGQAITPDEIIARTAASNGGKQTQTQINLTDPLTARAVLKSALAQALGRAPNPGEILDFTQALQANERANPARTISSVKDPTAGVETTTDQGTSPADFADQYVQDHYGQQIGTLNAATTLYRTAMQTLGAGGR